MAYNPAISHGQTTAGAIPAPVSPNSCVPYVAHFVIDQKVLTLSSGKFAFHDSQGKLVFDVKSKLHPVHTRRVLRDPSGKAICLMRKKHMTMHDRWAVYRGDDESDRSLLFTVGKTSLVQFTPSFGVYLGSNHSGTPDFTVKGDFFEHNYAIRYGNATVAEVRKKINATSLLIGKDQYAATVNPGVDHAFIAALIVIIDQVNHQED